MTATAIDTARARREGSVRLYRPTEAESVPRGTLRADQHAYLRALMGAAPSELLDGSAAQVWAASVGDVVVPLLVNDGDQAQTWIHSTRRHFVDLGRFEVEEKMKQPHLTRMLGPVFSTLGVAARLATLDRAVFVNHWLIPTDLWPDLDNDAIAELARALLRQFPNHALVCRTLAERFDGALVARLARQRFVPILSRPIYTLDPKSEAFLSALGKKGDLRRDGRLVEKADYIVEGHAQLREGDLERIVELYRKLYLDKHTQLNPQYTASYFRLAFGSGWLKLRALRSTVTGRIDAFVTWIVGHNRGYGPHVGYDQSLPKTLGLYRRLMMMQTREAQELGIERHMSGGAGAFKRARGGVQCLEHAAVHFDHLAPHRRAVWHVVAALYNQVGARVLRDVEL